MPTQSIILPRLKKKHILNPFQNSFIDVAGTPLGYVRTGASPHQLGSQIPLEGGMTLHFPPLEWHVFEFEPGGHVDILFIYGQVDHIRPEEIDPSELSGDK